MFEGFDMGSLWVMKDKPTAPVYRVVGHAVGSEGLTIFFTLPDSDEMIGKAKDWVHEHMQPAVA